MSPADERYWRLAHARAAALHPSVAAAVLRAFSIVRDGLSDAELARLIDAGDLTYLIATVFSEAVLDRAFIPLRLRLRDATQQAFKYTVPSLPRGGKVDGVLAVSFDHLSPSVVQGIRTLETKAITSLKDDTREAVRAFVENGLRDGLNPKAIGRNIRAIVGMSPTQAENSVKYEAKLRAAEKPLPAARIERMVAAYRKKAVSQNAATIARTATLDAFRQGQRLAWQDAIDSGVVQGDRLMKTWVGVLDDRERELHVKAEGETVPFNDPFPTTGEVTPGESTYNCRCLAKIFVA